MQVIKFERSGDKDKKWKDQIQTADIKIPDDKRDIVQNIYLVDGNKILITGNFFTILDIDLNQLNQVHCDESHDRFFVSTLNRAAMKPRHYFLSILPYLSDVKSDYNPCWQKNMVPGPEGVDAKTSNQNSWVMCGTFDLETLKFSCDWANDSILFKCEYV